LIEIIISLYNSALVQSGSTAIYLGIGRNTFGFIVGIDQHCFDGDYLRGLVTKVNPENAKSKRPF